jgi:hypothetical protein
MVLPAVVSSSSSVAVMAASAPGTSSSNNDALSSAPEQHVTPETVDAMLAQELNQMSFQERECVNEEIHGVNTLAIDEAPAFVNEKLMLLDLALDRWIAPHQKMAYLEALRLNSQYVHDVETFRLPFLRAELFDVHRAALRAVKFLDYMYELFGSEALMRPIFLSDFNDTDLKMMKEGFFQVIPGRDRSGRRIMGIFGDIPTEYDYTSRVRSIVFVSIQMITLCRSFPSLFFTYPLLCMVIMSRSKLRRIR